MNDAKFWRRVSASGIDMLVFLIVAIPVGGWTSGHKELAMAATAMTGFLYAAYSFALHGKYGQTVGKRLLGLRVVGPEGVRITMRQSARRSMLVFICSVPWVAATLSAMSRIPDSMYHAPRDKAYFVLEAQLRPGWYGYAEFALLAVLTADIAAFFWTRRRQTLHDLIGDTVVVHEAAA